MSKPLATNMSTPLSENFNMAPHGKELWGSEKRIVALHKDGVGYKKIAKTLKLSCSTVAKTIQRFNRTGSTQNRPRHGRPKKLSARAPHHIQRLCLGNRCNSAASIATEVEGVGGQPVSAQTIHRTLYQIGVLTSVRYYIYIYIYIYAGQRDRQHLQMIIRKPAIQMNHSVPQQCYILPLYLAIQ